MTRSKILLVTVCVVAGLTPPAWAVEPPEERAVLVAKRKELQSAGSKAYQAGRLADARVEWEEGLAVARRLYPKADFPDGHEDLAVSLNSLGVLNKTLGKHAEAEALYREALDVRRRLHKGDHRGVATCLNNLAMLYEAQGRLAEAERVCREALDMRRRLFTADDPDLAVSLLNTASIEWASGRLAAAEGHAKDSAAMYRRLYKKDHPAAAAAIGVQGNVSRSRGRYSDAERLYREALEIRRRLYPGDHPAVAANLNNLGAVAVDQGRPADAERFYRDAFEMRIRIFKGDHPSVAESHHNLACLAAHQGKYAEAEARARDVLTMSKRIYPADHPAVATGLNNLANFCRERGKLDEAGSLFRATLEMDRRLFKGDHPDVARDLNNLAGLLVVTGRPREAEPLYREALGMHERLYPGDHPLVADTLNNLGSLYRVVGPAAEADRLASAALDMTRRLYPGDHPQASAHLHNLACLHRDRREFAAALPLFRDAAAMDRRLTRAFAALKPEGEALTLVASLPASRDLFLTCARHAGTDGETAYAEVWASKGSVARVYERRRQAARAAADPAVANLLADSGDARRRRAELLLAPYTADVETRKRREDELRDLDAAVARLDAALGARLPAAARAARLDAATPADLRAALPADAAVVDFLRYVRDEPGGPPVRHYLAFVVTRDRVSWVDLGDAKAVEAAVASWRAAIAGGRDVPGALPAVLRGLVWDPVRAKLPAAVKAVYMCPDEALTRVPWAALPGDKPGSILLEDYAVAVIPHAAFLLDKLWPQDRSKTPPTGALVVGGVRYGDGQPAATSPRADPSPGAGVAGWPELPATAVEAAAVTAAVSARQLAPTALSGDLATAAAIREALPKARYAHLATHGFFADASFRTAFRLDETDFVKLPSGERRGRAANNPLVMTGLVFADANDPKAPGRGIVTGEALVDLDLSALELAVLSACETGLGDVNAGEGTFSLQRAFHLAGTRDVVASLWKVPDDSTAALMSLFYSHLWAKGLPPVEALRQAQLEIYRRPGAVPGLAEKFRGEFKVVPGAAGAATVKSDPVRADAGGKTSPLHWAAFTLSGPGR